MNKHPVSLGDFMEFHGFKTFHAKWFQTNSNQSALFSSNQAHRSLLDEIVKKCDLGFQIGKHFLQICSSFEQLQCETKSVIEEILFEFKRRALLSRKQTELSVSTHFQLWKTKTILWFQRRWMAVLWTDINQLLEVGPNDCITSARTMTVTNLSTIWPKTISRRFLLKLLG